MRRRALPALSLLLPLLALPAVAAGPPVPRKPLTLELAAGQQPLVSRAPSSLAWRDARRFTYLLTDGWGPAATAALWEVDAATGQKAKLLEPPPVPSEPGSAPKEPEAKQRTLPLTGAQWSPAGTALLLSGESDLWLWDAGTRQVRRLTRDEDAEELPSFSPDGRRIAYVKKNDLHALEVETGKETRLTTTGEPHVLNGKLDWVYEEELAGRRSGRSYEWAPDGKAIAYLRLDERRVPEYPLVDYFPTNGRLEPQRYPKPGDPNSIPSVHVVDLAGAETASVTLAPDDVYVGPELFWTADSASAGFLLLDRPQTSLEVRLVPRNGGAGAATRTLLTETDPAWVNSLDAPVFLRDRSGFLFVSERTGFLHLHRFGADGTPRNAVTKGPWMLDRSWEVDEKGGFVYFAATEKDPRERHVYRARLDGSGFTRLSEGRGTHSLTLSPDGRHYVDSFSDLETPGKLALHRADGSRVALIHEAASQLQAYALGTSEMGSFPAADGTLLYTKLVKPADFDPAKRYPVVVSVYGGPHAQVVADRFGATSLFDHLLASKGYLVYSVDNRGSWGRGKAFEAPILRRLGQVELADQLEGVAQLKKLPFVDGARIGIWGWSYGGFMALHAALNAGATFKVAVAGAPVTDWKLYDSIYTERYMKLPKENEAGYRETSLLAAAGKLTGKVQIQHGTSDDNVHMQQSLLLIDALSRARKGYEFVPLPKQKHGPRDPAYRLYSYQRALEFLERNL